MDAHWEAIGGVLGFLATGAFILIGFLAKKVLTDIEDTIDGIKEEVKMITSNCLVRHEGLPKTFVPRSEIQVITDSLKDSADQNRRQLEALHTKVDSLILLVKNGGQG